jgi:hypothetical protein
MRFKLVDLENVFAITIFFCKIDKMFVFALEQAIDILMLRIIKFANDFRQMTPAQVPNYTTCAHRLLEY